MWRARMSLHVQRHQKTPLHCTRHAHCTHCSHDQQVNNKGAAIQREFDVGFSSDQPTTSASMLQVPHVTTQNLVHLQACGASLPYDEVK